MRSKLSPLLLLLIFLSSFIFMATGVYAQSESAGTPTAKPNEPDITVNINGDDNDFSLEVIDNRIEGNNKVLSEEEYKEFMYLLSKVMQDREGSLPTQVDTPDVKSASDSVDTESADEPKSAPSDPNETYKEFIDDAAELEEQIGAMLEMAIIFFVGIIIVIMFFSILGAVLR